MNKYHRTLTNHKGETLDEVDVYDVLEAFNVTCPAIQHAAKKLLCTGVRGHKDTSSDIQDVLDSVERAKILNNQRTAQHTQHCTCPSIKPGTRCFIALCPHGCKNAPAALCSHIQDVLDKKTPLEWKTKRWVAANLSSSVFEGELDHALQTLQAIGAIQWEPVADRIRITPLNKPTE